MPLYLPSGLPIGQAFHIWPPTAQLATNYSSSEDLATSGGTLAIPFYINAPFKYSLLAIHNRNTASARASEFRLYYYDGVNLVFVPGTDGTFSFTPGAVSNRTAAPSGAPVLLQPGAYWLAIRNTSGAQNFSVGYVNPTTTLWNSTDNAYTQTLGSALGATLTTAGWTATTRIYAAMLVAPAFGI